MKYSPKLKFLPTLFALLLSVLLIAAVVFWTLRHSRHGAETGIQMNEAPSASSSPLANPSVNPSPNPSVPAASPNPSPSLAPSAAPAAGSTVAAAVPPNAKPDLAVDANGLSHVTCVVNTNEGVIKFKFYPQDAPNTVNRFIELVQKGFYNGLTFHRVVPGFVVQGGDPLGNGTGGSGQKLKAEFNNRHHIEGTVAMARAQDPDSADSQFYISLGTHPHLDHNYTVFGQVIEGMDVVRKLKVGDKMTSVTLEQ